MYRERKLLFPRHVEGGCSVGVCGFYGKGDHVTIIFRAIYCGWLRLPFAIFNKPRENKSILTITSFTVF